MDNVEPIEQCFGEGAGTGYGKEVGARSGDDAAAPSALKELGEVCLQLRAERVNVIEVLGSVTRLLKQRRLDT